MGRYEEAIASYNRAIEINPDYANAWNHKARCYARWGNVELAIESLQKSIELRPEYFNNIATESDFDPIRDAVKFKQLIRAGQLSQII
ncbi:MAG: tetratricopeptide repeat protein [Leptolyngbyaceae cyanobacterium SM1_4_3]|nr:tetratricopeptide repeat protein [Leptolyngbyaceae cyanobacterium SM1_4_3]